jgi:hypothetical protein
MLALGRASMPRSVAGVGRSFHHGGTEGTEARKCSPLTLLLRGEMSGGFAFCVFSMAEKGLCRLRPRGGFMLGSRTLSSIGVVLLLADAVAVAQRNPQGGGGRDGRQGVPIQPGQECPSGMTECPRMR